FALVLRWVNSPRRMQFALNGAALASLAITLIGMLGSQWMTYRIEPTLDMEHRLPQLPAAWLRALGASDRLHPNEVGAVLMLLGLPLLGALMWSWRGEWSRTHLVLMLLALLASAAFIALSVSRGVWLASAFALLWLLAQRSVRLAAAALLVSALALLLALRLLPTQIVQGLLFSDLLAPQWFAAPTRISIWQSALDMLRASPWVGIGLGAFPAAFHARVADIPFYNVSTVPHAHDLLLQAALDIGVIGMLAYLALMIGAFIASARAARALRTGALAGAAHGLSASVIAWLVFGPFDTVTLTSRAAFLVWIVLALATACTSLVRSPAHTSALTTR
ncbi:MAG: O-antigen ligase family protein, partial [Chloroflexi bacterium]|nr:O-antigen ligase family protein [Chloroflexota bacterium]